MRVYATLFGLLCFLSTHMYFCGQLDSETAHLPGMRFHKHLMKAALSHNGRATFGHSRTNSNGQSGSAPKFSLSCLSLSGVVLAQGVESKTDLCSNAAQLNQASKRWLLFRSLLL